MSKYSKKVLIQYKYIDSPESEKALADIFDSIFDRIARTAIKPEIPKKSNILTIS